MKQTFDLSELSWQVAGFVPYEWRLGRCLEISARPAADIAPIPATVPGSVQGALRNAGLLPDWNQGLNARLCDWVENRHWIYETLIPDNWVRPGRPYRLRCQGLDYAGCIMLNGHEVAAFENAHIPLVVDLTPHLAPTGNRLQIVFECPPRWLGQFGYTSRMKDPKPRFNYFWDWTCRLVQIGIWDRVLLESPEPGEISSLNVSAGFDTGRQQGSMRIRGTLSTQPAGSVLVQLTEGNAVLREERFDAATFAARGVAWRRLPVRPWWPNGLGDQPLYTLRVRWLDAADTVLDEQTRGVGFLDCQWRPCEGAVPEADPWICLVNDRPVFLQGVNWTPIRPNFADASEAECRARLVAYRDLGFNLVRVWGGAFLEREYFYRLCDELGLLVWQEFPLSSSGVDNYPPDDPASLLRFEAIARSFLERRHHHVSVIVWCGGNELRADRVHQNTPITLAHPLIRRFQRLVHRLAPGRRFVPSAPTGPRFNADAAEFGKGVHWAVNGPWKAEGRLEEGWSTYWSHDDALFRSEVGAPGPSSADLIRRYAGDAATMPGTLANPLWRRSPWWVEWHQFAAEKGHEPANLEEYVAWGQQRQADALRIAAGACKGRFPRCGGFIVWMGHDCFPCCANTSILDFDGRPKPAALALASVWKDRS